MKIITCADAERYRFSSSFGGHEVSPEIFSTVQRIISDVRREGDGALFRYTKQFDRFDLRETGIEVSEAERRGAYRSIDASLRKALHHAAERITVFHELQREESWRSEASDGSFLGQQITPLERAGLYIPGGKATYPSSVLMNALPAKIAGVDELVMVVPTPDGELPLPVLAAAEVAGVHRIFRIGGAQAVAALAYGTESIPKVDKVVGPGNIYVATAKRLLYGTIDIDMIAGPSEILIIADHTADPVFIAADLLSQAEHDEMAVCTLITCDGTLPEKVLQEVKSQSAVSSRRGIIEKALQNYGEMVIVPDLKLACALSNLRAPEHLEVMTEDPESLLPELRNAGAIFLGAYSPEPLGDYIAGPNHVLPTGGTARFFSPLGVYDFLTRSSVIHLSEAGFRALAGDAVIIAEHEGLSAHARSLRVRGGDGFPS